MYHKNLIFCGIKSNKPRLCNNIVIFPSLGNGYFGRYPNLVCLPSSTQSKKEAVEDKKQTDDEKFQLTLTCKKCNTPIRKVITKQAYFNGFVIINCEACKNKYLIADNLNCLTGAKGKKNIKEIMSEKGDTVQKIVSINLESSGMNDEVKKSGLLLKSAVVTCVDPEEDTNFSK